LSSEVKERHYEFKFHDVIVITSAYYRVVQKMDTQFAVWVSVFLDHLVCLVTHMPSPQIRLSIRPTGAL